MKLYIRHKDSWFNDSEVFSVATEDGKMKYDMKIQTMLLKQIRLVDTDKNELALIKQELKSLTPKYSVFIGGEKVLTVTKKLHILPKYNMEGSGLDIQCGPMLHNYELLKDGVVVARVTPKNMEWSETYEIDILVPQWETLVVAAAVAIECGIEVGENTLRRP